MYAVLFDIDGTLIQTGGAGHHAFKAAFHEVFGITEFPEGVPFAGRSDRAIATDVMDRAGIEPSPANWLRFYSEFTQRIEIALRECQGRVLPGVVELLQILQQDEHAVLGLLTGNCEFGARAKTFAYGLEEYFSFGGYGDVRTHRNDIAAEALAAAQQFVMQTNGAAGEPLCGAMVIGDTPADVECGRAIDAFVVAVATGNSSAEELAACGPDLVLEDLGNAASLIAETVSARERCSQLAS